MFQRVFDVLPARADGTCGPCQNALVGGPGRDPRSLSTKHVTGGRAYFKGLRGSPNDLLAILAAVRVNRKWN